MASIFAVKQIEPLKPTPVEKRGVWFYRFYSNKGDELYWNFYYKPSQRLLDATCRALKYPNYEEIDKIDFKRGKKKC